MYAPSYQTDTQGTMKLQPKITRRYNLRNRHNSSNNSRESSSDRSLRNSISISQPTHSCPTLTERNNPSCSVSNEIGLSIDRYQSFLERLMNRTPIVYLKIQTKETEDQLNFPSEPRATNKTSVLEQIGITN